MAKVLLIMPSLPRKTSVPYLGQQYLASSLVKDGHEVRCLDLAAARFLGTPGEDIRVVGSWRPDMIGVTLFTQNALAGYRLAERLKGTTRLLLAGGPHPTACPGEPLRFGFDAVARGEGEQAVVAYARKLEGRRTGTRVTDLDALPFPVESLGCYDASSYSEKGVVVPGGMITSRGCPGRCTFCATRVAGRKHRWRSASNVVAEMALLREAHNVSHFSFWDDSFSACRSRVHELCDAIERCPALRGVTWSAITPANTVSTEDLRRMKEAGCVAINFGIESGDETILGNIRKGLTPAQAKAAVTSAKAEGMTTIANFMFGFPGEGVGELDRTLRFMEDISDVADMFNHGGVLVPYPGTVIYDRNHSRYGFTEWWLDPRYLPDEPDMFGMDPDRAQQYLERDGILDLDFFRYTDEVREKIAACVRFKARHNQRYVEKCGRAAMEGKPG
ncbi:MAG: radical SAM protein [Deltaproteobacteria bacterium]|nr:radical SAM protein [Deltaproteobacteria bacterium]